MVPASVLSPPRFLLLGLAVCALLLFASRQTRPLLPAHRDAPAAATGSFQPDGWYPGEPFAHARGVRAWGSWSGGDENTGTLALGPFPAPRVLRFGIGGYPDHAGNRLHVELAGTATRLPIPHGAVGERWHVVDFELPPDWQGRPIRLVAQDDARTLGGWLALTEPIRGGRGDGANGLLESFAAWALNGLLLGTVFLAAARTLLAFRGGPSRLQNPGTLPAPWLPLGAAALVAVAGYAAFWAYFANALLGVVFSWSVILGSVVVLLRGARRDAASAPDPAAAESAAEFATAVKLLAAVGAFHLALLHLFPSSHEFYTLAGNRYAEALPTDNTLPHGIAERLFSGKPPKDPADAWLSSDRPPLQSGWQLLTWPAAKLLDLDRRTVSGTSAVWFQLLWVAGAYGLLRTLGVPRARAAGWTAVCALSGFFVQNTIFTWPKLSAGAFAVAAFAQLFLPAAGTSLRSQGAWSALFAGLAWLSHGGAAFSFLPLLPVLAWRALRGAWRPWLPGLAVLLLLALPWVAYQKFYDPPGNRLLKWHLGGDEAIDQRGTLEVIRAGYAKLGWREAWSHKVANFHGQVFGDWKTLADPSPATALARRKFEFFHVGRALTWWPVLVLPALVLTRRRVLQPARDVLVLVAWLAATLVVWCLLIFGRYNAVIHHGSYAVPIGLFVLCAVLLDRAGRAWLPLLAALQAFTFATTWALANTVIRGPATGLPVVLVTGAIVAWFIARAAADRSAAERLQVPETAPAGPDGWTRAVDALRAWWAHPRLTLGVLAVLAFVLFLRKPDALHTPQLWAEDGSVFLNDQDQFGLRALLAPYMGYLHALPRLIAWLSAQLFDPAWWPACYNASAFAIWLAALARLLTPRFAHLPGRPWLVLAFLLIPHTGEVFFNITNLQWITGFVLIQQALVAAPRTRGERLRDLALLFIVGLTGPFVIAFLPLFAWRWWRARSRDDLWPLLAVAACAAVQAWFVVRVGPKFEFQSAPFQLWPNLVVLGRRLVLWPLLGRETALALPPALAGLAGTALLGAVLAWALRPHPRRDLRRWIIAALGLILLAGVYRARPDTWAEDNLAFADRYFYIPRVLLAWLLIWEFDAGSRLVAAIARLACVTTAVVHLWTYTLPAPKNYQWATLVEPIRRGQPADLPILPENWTLHYTGRPTPR